MGAPDGGKRPVCASMTTWKGCLCVPAYGACRWLCVPGRLRSLTPALSQRERGPLGVGEKFGVTL